MTKPPTSTANQDEYFLRGAEIALRDGFDVWDRWAEMNASGGIRKFALKDPTPMFECRGFFDSLTFRGKPSTFQGCLQLARFRPKLPVTADSGRRLSNFLLTELPQAFLQPYAKDIPGGFLFSPLLAKEKGKDSYISGPSLGSKVPLSSIGAQFEWVVYRIDLLDFGRSVPPLAGLPRIAGRLLKESVYVVVPERHVFLEKNPAPGVLVDFTFGYSVLPYTVIPNPFGYGPGHFGVAFKHFQFTLLEKGELQIQMNFLLCPRSEMVLNLGGVDPVYPFFDFLDKVASKNGKLSAAAHDRLDRIFMRQHARVHENALLVTRRFWEGEGWN